MGRPTTSRSNNNTEPYYYESSARSFDGHEEYTQEENNEDLYPYEHPPIHPHDDEYVIEYSEVEEEEVEEDSNNSTGEEEEEEVIEEIEEILEEDDLVEEIHEELLQHRDSTGLLHEIQEAEEETDRTYSDEPEQHRVIETDMNALSIQDEEEEFIETSYHTAASSGAFGLGYQMSSDEESEDEDEDPIERADVKEAIEYVLRQEKAVEKFILTPDQYITIRTMPLKLMKGVLEHFEECDNNGESISWDAILKIISIVDEDQHDDGGIE